MKRKLFIFLIVVIILGSVSTPVVRAQEEEYRVHVRKEFGYNWGADIQGRFSVRLLGDETQVEQVGFFIDDTLLDTVKSAPFRVQFHTDDFADGVHRLFAEVQLKDGRNITTSALTYHFLDPQDANQDVGRIFLYIGGALLGTLLIVGLLQVVLLKSRDTRSHQPGEPRQYGLLGGTICPKCGRPFSRHIWGMNLVVGRLDRCKNCGKWVMTVRATPAALKAAEEAEWQAYEEEQAQAINPPDLDQDLDDTRYFDHL
jgi:hypothetical protein